jgi:hypothetical protein
MQHLAFSLQPILTLVDLPPLPRGQPAPHPDRYASFDSEHAAFDLGRARSAQFPSFGVVILDVVPLDDFLIDLGEE